MRSLLLSVAAFLLALLTIHPAHAGNGSWRRVFVHQGVEFYVHSELLDQKRCFVGKVTNRTASKVSASWTVNVSSAAGAVAMTDRTPGSLKPGASIGGWAAFSWCARSSPATGIRILNVRVEDHYRKARERRAKEDKQRREEAARRQREEQARVAAENLRRQQELIRKQNEQRELQRLQRETERAARQRAREQRALRRQQQRLRHTNRVREQQRQAFERLQEQQRQLQRSSEQTQKTLDSITPEQWAGMASVVDNLLKGISLGISIGAGSLAFDCSGAGCESRAGFAFALRLGTRLDSSWALMAEVSLVMAEVDDVGASVSGGQGEVGLQFWPMSRFWLALGVGTGLLTLRDANDNELSDLDGVALTAGVGLELYRSKRNFAVDLRLRASRTVFDDGTLWCVPGAQCLPIAGAANATLMLGLTWY